MALILIGLIVFAVLGGLLFFGPPGPPRPSETADEAGSADEAKFVWVVHTGWLVITFLAGWLIIPDTWSILWRAIGAGVFVVFVWVTKDVP